MKEPLSEIEDPALLQASLSNEIEIQNYLGASFAWLGGQVTKKLDSGSQTSFGLYYSVRDTELELWDVQAHWLSSKAAWLQVGKKFLFSYDYEQEPYYRLAISHFADPDDSLAGLTRFDSFKATAALGLLDIMSLGRYWSAEAGLHWGTAGLAFHIQSAVQWTF